mmetsp:Transcript_20814/g.57859  ORF Transcript_20814/g.57859 Transcript_20814/m.57859 type:complete len:272 (-) Transcript_20814:803-1618(-)|eukprot:CAMPEP_0198120550 /NCGR_PEP_ID=MMETSP1442-20131203/29400_1 /TAXON_ID= /ORGANISM="Craspedostauros australis, Strain CCMP3328" /LENGTH=271 /DNA_ID=CAMNT_0043779211 /DNA_START=66 /DNA_END=881 /DNA_ORIENTATION=+
MTMSEVSVEETIPGSDAGSSSTSRRKNTSTNMPTTKPGSFPLVLRSMKCGYLELVWMIGQMTPAKANTLLPELCVKIAEYCVVQKVVPSQVTAVSASSHDGAHDLSCSLDTQDDSTWWISGRDTMQQGRGREWVQYRLAGDDSYKIRAQSQSQHHLKLLQPAKPRRLTTMCVKIPPLPMGPLSVRDCHVEAKCVPQGNDEAWSQVSPRWTVSNRSGLQRFHLPRPVDATEVRIVCHCNQFAPILEEFEDGDMIQSSTNYAIMVGYFAVKFE